MFAARFYIKHLFIVVIVLSNKVFAQVVNINAGVKIVAKGQVSLVVNNGGIKNDGTFIADSSTVIFDGGAVSSAITGSQPITFFNLGFKGTGTKINNANASVLATLAITGTTVLDADGTLNDKSFTLKSSDTATANVDVITSGNIIGNVTVERFINTGTGTGQHAKSWQFLATPTSGQSIFQSWQEGAAVPAGYGTWVTGTGSGFDAITTLPSVKYYDPVGNAWTAVINTSNSLQNKQGYMLFVRGDRTVNTYNGAPNNTNMRSKGVLFTPSNPPPSVPVLANLFQSFGNPYASRIEFNKVWLASTGINNVFYVWDPRLNGTYNLGGYQTLSSITGYVPTAGTVYYPAAVPSPYIESGQAVFVKGNAAGGNVNFNENCKTSGNRLVNKTAAINQNTFSNRQFLFTSLFTNTSAIADGNIVVFEDGLGNELNEFDAEKIPNSGENFGIKRNDKILAVEARNLINAGDTICYHFQNLRQQDYQLQFAPLNILTIFNAWLIDRYNNNATHISLTDSSFFSFTITADPASADNDRFILVFKEPVVVPVVFIGIAANRNGNKTNTVAWKVTSETNIQEYKIQRSYDGAGFQDIGATAVIINNGGTGNYHFIDETPLNGLNFYRIKAIENNGYQVYSSIVKLENEDSQPSIIVYPNPVVDHVIQISFINQKKGSYIVILTNKQGQVVSRDIVFIEQSNVDVVIKPANLLAAGTYQLAITGDDGKKAVKQLIVE